MVGQSARRIRRKDVSKETQAPAFLRTRGLCPGSPGVSRRRGFLACSRHAALLGRNPPGTPGGITADDENEAARCSSGMIYRGRLSLLSSFSTPCPLSTTTTIPSDRSTGSGVVDVSVGQEGDTDAGASEPPTRRPLLAFSRVLRIFRGGSSGVEQQQTE